MCVCVCLIHTRGMKVNFKLCSKMSLHTAIMKNRGEESKGQAEVGREEMNRIKADEDREEE